MILQGNCLEILPTLEAESVDAIVTDPPYGLSFMGKDWDHGIPGIPYWQAALRVAKPGAYLLAFGGTRTFHRLACAIEDAGWEIRDTIMWVYGSGFPKSHDVSKAIDREAGARREVISTARRSQVASEGWDRPWKHEAMKTANSTVAEFDITAPATDAARQWEGWGTALKPAWEPIIVARKPINGTVAANVQKYGTGGLNIDGCRIPFEDTPNPATNPMYRKMAGYKNGNSSDLNSSSFSVKKDGSGERPAHNLGRWPANLILSYPEDEYELRDDVTPAQLRELAEWMENRKRLLLSDGKRERTTLRESPKVTNRS